MNDRSTNTGMHHDDGNGNGMHHDDVGDDVPGEEGGPADDGMHHDDVEHIHWPG